MSWKAPLLVAALAGVAAVVYASGPALPHLRWPSRAPARSRAPADAPPVLEQPGGLVVLAEGQRRALGLQTAEVRPQTEPIRLELPGITAYDPDTLTKIRPRFDALVRAVHAGLGQRVARGDPLVELYSAELARAKTEYETKRTRWEHDHHLLVAREPLAKTGAIAERVWFDTQDDEIESQLAAQVARDALLVYGLTDEQIEAIDREAGAAKALMTLRAPTDGILIAREAVPGNLYGPSDVLMVIAPLDDLWVWANVSGRDIPLVSEGRTWEVRFPHLDLSVRGQVDYVADQVDPGTHAVRIRGTVANPGRRLKADMIVRALLEIPPVPGRTVIPRAAMVVADGRNDVFVRVPGRRSAFERRPIRVAQEGRDQVVVESGLRPGEVVVTEGSLLLADIENDLRTTSPEPPDDLPRAPLD